MYKVGLTGGIGSGKSTVAKVFRSLGVPVYDADIETRKLIDSDPNVIEVYQSLFGERAYVDGKLDRQYVAGIVFNDQDLLKQLESQVHPLVYLHFLDWCEKQEGDLVIKESAILFESGGDRFLNEVITVTAPLELRKARVMKRDGLTEEAIMARVRNQWDDELKIAASTYVIHADERQLVVPQVLEVYRELKQKAAGAFAV